MISEDDLLEISDKDILHGLRYRGAVYAKRILLRRDGEEKGTKYITLTFNDTKLPDSIKAAYLN